MKIAVLDDDPIALELVKQALLNDEAEWWESRPECTFFQNGKDMLEAVKTNAFDVVLLDRFVPDMSGDVILQWLRQYGERTHGLYTIVIMLTSMQSTQNELYSLKVGADDYIAKPFSPEKLILRINRMLKVRDGSTKVNELSTQATGFPSNGRADLFAAGHGYRFLDSAKVVILNDGQSVVLDEIEYSLAKYVFDNLDAPISKSAVLDKVWSKDQLGLRLLDSYLHRICMKLKLNAANGFTYRIIYGFGFSLSYQPPVKAAITDKLIAANERH